jgi:hypothetical protein
MVVLEEVLVLTAVLAAQEIRQRHHHKAVMAHRLLQVKGIMAGAVILALLTIAAGVAEQVRLVVAALVVVRQEMAVMEQRHPLQEHP